MPCRDRQKVRKKMQILIDIPDEQIKKSLEESKYIHEDEGEKGSVHITMLYTNAQLEFVAVERKTDFYSCEYKILPKEHGMMKDVDADKEHVCYVCSCTTDDVLQALDNSYASTIIEAESEDK